MLRGRLAQGDFGPGVGRGDPLQDGALPGVMPGQQALEIVKEKRPLGHHSSLGESIVPQRL
jgi:hypothetical protein